MVHYLLHYTYSSFYVTPYTGKSWMLEDPPPVLWETFQLKHNQTDYKCHVKWEKLLGLFFLFLQIALRGRRLLRTAVQSQPIIRSAQAQFIPFLPPTNDYSYFYGKCVSISVLLSMKSLHACVWATKESSRSPAGSHLHPKRNGNSTNAKNKLE